MKSRLGGIRLFLSNSQLSQEGMEVAIENINQVSSESDAVDVVAWQAIIDEAVGKSTVLAKARNSACKHIGKLPAI